MPRLAYGDDYLVAYLDKLVHIALALFCGATTRELVFGSTRILF